MLIKTIMRYHRPQVRMATTKKMSIGGGREKREPCVRTVGGNVHIYIHIYCYIQFANILFRIFESMSFIYQKYLSKLNMHI